MVKCCKLWAFNGSRALIYIGHRTFLSGSGLPGRIYELTRLGLTDLKLIWKNGSGDVTSTYNFVISNIWKNGSVSLFTYCNSQFPQIPTSGVPYYPKPGLVVRLSSIFRTRKQVQPSSFGPPSGSGFRFQNSPVCSCVAVLTLYRRSMRVTEPNVCSSI